MLNFETVKRYYDQGLWSEKWVRNAVMKGIITAEEYREITHQVYVGV